MEKAPNSVSLNDLRRIVGWVFDALEQKGVTEFSAGAHNDFYLILPTSDVSALEGDMAHVDVGRYSDEIGFLQTDLQADELSSIDQGIYALEILRALIVRH